MAKVRIGIVGSRFQADCIAASVKAMPDEAEVVAVTSPTRGNAEEFARRHGIPAYYSDYRDLLKDKNVEMISITAPNRLHAQITMDAAKAGKHVVCEKPLCMTLEEADAMIDACKAKSGRIDILHYNVGFSIAGGDAPTTEITEEAFEPPYAKERKFS